LPLAGLARYFILGWIAVDFRWALRGVFAIADLIINFEEAGGVEKHTVAFG